MIGVGLGTEFEKARFFKLPGDPCPFRLRDTLNPSKIKMILRVLVHHVTVARYPSKCDVLCRFLRKPLPTNNFGELTYYSSSVLERGWERGALKSSLTVCFD